MGIISCQINVFKPPNGIYKPGELVSGVIKYTMLETVDVKKITTSLKGTGNIILEVHKGTKNRVSYKTTEVLIDEDNIVQDESMKMLSGDSDEVTFSFTLPHKIPSTSRICKSFDTFKATCVIKYYIRIKFEGPGIFSINKHFRKEIIVLAEVAPRLSREPVTYAKTKKLVRLFSLKDGFINIKATILNSALPIGGKIQLRYEVENNSHVIVKSILTKLIEVYTFKAEGRKSVKYEEDVPNTDEKKTLVNCQETRHGIIDINVSPNLYCLENSKVVARYHLIRIKLDLPLPHGSIVLDVPVQIGVIKENIDDNELQNLKKDDPPPSYWEVMGEARKEEEDNDSDS